MSKIMFHKCRLCHCLFYAGAKTSYCTKCVPKGTTLIGVRLSDLTSIEGRRARERERWHRRMMDPKFREAERLRSLARARANRKYAKLGGEE